MFLHLNFTARELPLRHPFTISRYTVTLQQMMIVSISDGTFTGYGEATANPYYNSSIEKMTASLSRVKPVVEAAADLHPAELWQQLEPLLADDYFALCAIDVAYWDYYARRHQKTLRAFWSDVNSYTPMTSYTIGIDDIEIMKQKI